jgi:DNA-directed RNA polymerase specialized sigma24 family protein
MNKIYILISELTDQFKEMCYGLTTNKNDIENAVQELMLYFLQMNPAILKNIYDKDGKKGIIRYGAVVLRRALQSPRSPFYYKYKKYYTHVDRFVTDSTYIEYEERTVLPSSNNICNLPNPVEPTQWVKLEKIDKELDKMYWYDQKVFQLYYYESNTLDSLAKKTGISRNSLFTTIHKVKNIIKKELVDEVE